MSETLEELKAIVDNAPERANPNVLTTYAINLINGGVCGALDATNFD